jgi:hypothetical protein
MDRALPEFNTILHKKWNALNKKMHKKKLAATTAAVDNNMPHAMQYPLVKTKKDLIIEGKLLIVCNVNCNRAMQ